MADGTGVGVQFASGDSGSNFTELGINVPGYPAVSPYATAVGGTTLEISKQDTRAAEYGWSTSGSVLCTKLLSELEFPWLREPVWHMGPRRPWGILLRRGRRHELRLRGAQLPTRYVVPAALAARNSKITHVANRVVPDISADAARETGLIIGLTETFANGTHYNQVKGGGTSLASPLLAGIIADVDQVAAGPLGFINPLIYKLRAESGPLLYPGALYDELPAGKQAEVEHVYVNGENAQSGKATLSSTIGYEGPEEYCSGTDECETQNVQLHAGPGFD